MKRHNRAAAALLAACFALNSTAVSAEEKIVNGSFSENQTVPWQNYNEDGACAVTVSDGVLDILITDPGTVAHGVQLYQTGIKLYQGSTYELCFTASSDIPKDMEWRAQKNSGDYHAYAADHLVLTEAPTEYRYTFEMTEASDPDVSLAFNMGTFPDAEKASKEHHVYLDDISLTLVTAGAEGISAGEGQASAESGGAGDDSAAAQGGSNGGDLAAAQGGGAGASLPAGDVGIAFDQVGYGSTDPKYLTVFSNDDSFSGAAFSMVDPDGAIVFDGTLTESVYDDAAGVYASSADFSALTEDGSFSFVLHQDTSRNAAEKQPDAALRFDTPVTIEESPLSQLSPALLGMLTLQRCGTEVRVQDSYHAACHQTAAKDPQTGNTGTVPGGWHDAGDYGRYTVPAAKTAADLMLAHTFFPDACGDDTGIPESGNGMADILDEARYGLEWMLLMQDETSGGVHHKLTAASFPGFIMPEEETAEQLLCPVSTTATGDFAAVMAMASSVFRPFDEAFAARCLDASVQAFAYLEDTPSDPVGFHNPAGISTGEYDDTNDLDERFWAAAALYSATEDPQYLEAARSLREEIASSGQTVTGLGWQSVGMYGTIALLQSMEPSDPLFSDLQQTFLAEADRILTAASESPFGVSLRNGDYCWGSNMSVANNGMVLLMAGRFADTLFPADSADEKDYRETALSQLHYLLGNNINRICYVTGFGAVSPQHPHHRPSAASGKAYPGMLVGGPDQNLEDGTVAAACAGASPAACYTDQLESYSTNETATYWNSPLIFLTAGLLSD